MLRHRSSSPSLSLTQKTNRVLHIILITFFFIAFRIWHLSVIQKEEKIQEAQKPKTRTVLLKADRGEILDRFHKPLATNKICYNASIYYDALCQVPARGWKESDEGEKIRTFPRKEYIGSLSELLGGILEMDPERVEDLIYARASLLPHVPFVLKTDISEESYYRLKMLEKDWIGLQAEITSRREYPMQKTGCHLLGYLGSISTEKYRAISEEIAHLKETIARYELEGPSEDLFEEYGSIESALLRLEELKDKAYTLNDRVGKGGIEAEFEEELRGRFGLKKVEVDRQGKILRELPGSKEPIAGSTIVLSISSELQQFAEELLIRNEQEREGRSLGIDPISKQRKIQKQPWIKGGSIVAIDPNSGEVLAFASYPRFNPNDFIQQNKTGRYLETPSWIASIWDGHEALHRETWVKNRARSEEVSLSWDFYLSQVVPKESPIYHFFEKSDDLRSAIQLQEDFQALLYFANGKDASSLAEALEKKNALFDQLRQNGDALPHLRRLDAQLQAITASADKLFTVDLCRLAADGARFSDELLAKVGSMKIAAYRALHQAFARFEKKQREGAEEEFHQQEFAAWRQDNQKDFLKQKRAEEKALKAHAKPYLDYLDEKEKGLFHAFWKEHRLKILMTALKEKQEEDDATALQKAVAGLTDPLQEEFLKTFRFFNELERPLLCQLKKIKTEKDLAEQFYPSERFGFTRSYAYVTSAPQGSVFKLVAAYEGLRQGLHFSLIDESKQEMIGNRKQMVVAYSTNNTPYPRIYKGGRLPKTSAAHVGKIDMVGAICHSSNPFFSILAGDYFKHPEDLNRAAAWFGYGQKTGIELPGEIAGNLPKDLATNRTGLYAYAIGQHTLLATPLQSAMMLTALANGGQYLKPLIVKTKIRCQDPFMQREGNTKVVQRKIDLPPPIRTTILEGMDKVIWGERGSSRPSIIRGLVRDPALMHDFLALEHQFLGKTGTAEILYKPYCFPSCPALMYKHIWFGSIAFPSAVKMRFDSPELVVVVFLRFGDGGKEAAPLAAQVVRKWREIVQKEKRS